MSSLPCPWDKPPSIPTIIAPAEKRHHPSRETVLFRPLPPPNTEFHIYTDGSVREEIKDSSAGSVVLSQDLIHEWHARSGSHSSSFQAEKAAIKEAIQLLSSISLWASAAIICNCKSMVQSISNANSADLSVIQLQAAATVLVMSKSILIV